jgi:hypothetical protein
MIQWKKLKRATKAKLQVPGCDCPNAILVFRIVKGCVWTSMLGT